VLDYFGARYFSSQQGRFMSPDVPLLDQHVGDPQSWNLYTYGRNNPLRLIDPSGHQAADAQQAARGCGWSVSCWANVIMSTITGNGMPPVVVMQDGFDPPKKDPVETAEKVVKAGESLLNAVQPGADNSPAEGPTTVDPAKTPVYRGGTDMTIKPDEMRVGADGMVRPTHGPSVSTTPEGLEKFGGARQIESMPDGLQIIQRGRKPSHHEVVLARPMSPEEFQSLLTQIVFR